jgi:triosephosphate isomerase
MADRKPFIAGNWKMHHTHLEAIQVVQKLSYRLDQHDFDDIDIVVCPPFTALRSVQTTLEGDRIPIALGAQNCHFEPEGAFTGEISAPMLAKLHVQYVIVGHSERRQLMGETDDIVTKKLRAVLAAGMSPILCVGETLDQRETGQTDDIVTGQVRAAFANLPADAAARCVVAYEPIWAIGTGQNATSDDASEMATAIRRVVGEIAGATAAESVRIQYGGSVVPENASELLSCEGVDGLLVGGASLDAERFAAILHG